MTPETKALILRDFRAGKATSAAALGKLHGVSRSAVYRALKSLNVSASSQAKEPSQPNRHEEPERHEDREEYEAEELIPQDMVLKMNSFADELGLPNEGSHLRHDVEEKSPAQQRADEEVLDRVMGRLAGDTDFGAENSAMDGILNKIYAEPPPPRSSNGQGQARPSLESMAYRQPLAPRQPPALVTQAAASADLTQRIIFNVEHFGPHLRTIIGENKEAFIQSLASRSALELQGLLSTIERTRSVGNLATGFKQAFFMVSQAVETGSGIIGMRTRGFTEQLKEQDEEITMCLKEIAINEWERLKALDSPQIRLGSLFCMTLIQTDARNRMGDQLRRVVSSPVNESVAAANEDL